MTPVPRRLLPSLSLLSLVVYAAFAALLTVLLPSQIAALDPERKVENLAAVTSVSFAFTIVAQPLVGALSDRTRSRLGRRVPWILGGAVVAGTFLVGLGGLGSLMWIGVFWVVIQFALNGIEASASAVVPDRLPRSRWGIASAIVGLGTMTGGAIGTVAATRLTGQLDVAYAGLGGLVIIATVAFALLNRAPDAAAPVIRRGWREFFTGFWVNPGRDPDFAWAFAARMVFIFGYSLVYAFQLYVLTDYIGLPARAATDLLGAMAVVSFCTILVAVVVAGWWSDRTGRRKAFVLAACGILALALLVPLLLPTPAGMLLFAGIKGLAFGIVLSSGSALFLETLPGGGAAAGKDLGILNVAINVPQTLSPVVAALVVGVTGGYHWLFVVAMLASLAAAVLFGRIRGVR